MESNQSRVPWNKGKLVGQKPPLKPKDIWAIRIHLQNDHQVRDLAMFNLAIDSKLRGCDLVNLHVRDVTHGNQVLPRAMVVQRKTQRLVQFELTGADQVCGLGVGRKGAVEAGALPVPESPGEIAPCFYSPVRPNRASVGCRYRTRYDGLWHAYHATDQGDTDLQANQESKGRPALARS